MQNAEQQMESQRVFLALGEEFDSALKLIRKDRDPVAYNHGGILELDLATPGNPVQLLNFRMDRPEDAPATLPEWVHFSLDTEQKVSGAIDPETGGGQLELPVLVEYPELIEMDPPMTVAEAREAPPTLGGRLKLELEPVDDEAYSLVRARASIVLEEMPGVSEEEIFIEWDGGTIEIQDGIPCCEICIHVTIGGERSKTPIYRRQYRAMMAEVSRIWGCQNGQCCINVRFAGLRYDNEVKMVTLRDGSRTDRILLEKYFKDNRRHAKRCFQVILTPRIWDGSTVLENTRHLGVTLNGRVKGTVVQLEHPSQPGTLASPRFIGQTLAHELGHAMGVSNWFRNSDTSGNGVDKHSDKDDNLMSPSANSTTPDNTLHSHGKLNAEQCKKARSSRLHKRLDTTCELAARESGAI